MIKYIIRKKIVYVLFISLFFLSGCTFLYDREYKIKPPQNIEIMEEMDVFFEKEIWEKRKGKFWDEETNSYNYAKRYSIYYKTKKQKCSSYSELCMWIEIAFYIDTKSNSITNLRISKTLVDRDFNQNERRLILKIFCKIKKNLKNKGSKLLEQQLDYPTRSAIDLSHCD